MNRMAHDSCRTVHISCRSNDSCRNTVVIPVVIAVYRDVIEEIIQKPYQYTKKNQSVLKSLIIAKKYITKKTGTETIPADTNNPNDSCRSISNYLL
jgi:hypothetical protein